MIPSLSVLALFIAFGQSTLTFFPAPTVNDTQNVMFNEQWLVESWQARRPRTNEEVLRVLDESDIADIDDRSAVVRYVLDQCPIIANVHPTEQYYYFKFVWKYRRISGNFRFCDSRKGVVHFGYFDEFDPAFTRFGSIVNCVNGTVRCEGRSVTVDLQGIARTFVIHEFPSSMDSAKVSRHEQVIAGVVDESGYCFWLVYNEKQRLMYYLLDESRLPEQKHLLSLRSVEIEVGVESRFVFFLDRSLNRRILIGVLAENVRKNNYFDGPFDQVPPDLQIKAILEDVYPYVKERKVDAHGNFLDEFGARVAISPYVMYQSIPELLSVILLHVEYPELEEDVGCFYNLVRESKGVRVDDVSPSQNSNSDGGD